MAHERSSEERRGEEDMWETGEEVEVTEEENARHQAVLREEEEARERVLDERDKSVPS